MVTRALLVISLFAAPQVAHAELVVRIELYIGGPIHFGDDLDMQGQTLHSVSGIPDFLDWNIGARPV